MHYVGHLARGDPLYGYLRRDILPHLGVNSVLPEFQVHRLCACNHVYLYEDRHSGTRIVGKFFGSVAPHSVEKASRRMEAEYHNLHYLRSIGFTGHRHYVARPFGRNAGLNWVLVEEFCHGRSLADFILCAITEGARDVLFQKLAALAWFLATLHNRTASSSRVDFNLDCAYFEKIMGQLKSSGHIGRQEAGDLCRSKERWRETSRMWEDCQVLVHGDATPSNILLGEGPRVVAIDLERMRRADRVFDLGLVVGELKHFFMQYAGDGWAAEPFIGHFLWEYACHFPDRDAAFRSITGRIPFYMGLTLLRIARNDWIKKHHRRRLLEEAAKTFA